MFSYITLIHTILLSDSAIYMRNDYYASIKSLILFNFKLPQKDNKIDFALMETFISALKKMAIRDVVLYNGQKTATTKALLPSTSELLNFQKGGQEPKRTD